MFDFVEQNCTRVFIDVELKKHRENVLLEKEKSLIPVTLPYVEKAKNIKKIQNQINEIAGENNQLLNLITKNNRKMADLRHLVYNIESGRGVQEISEKKKFIRKCPMNQCRGFLSTKWKCGICDTYICNRCNEEKHPDELDDEGNHMCKEENVKSMDLLNKDTKPCPNCASMIYKIDGCDMMFCVDCNTAFSWARGVIATGTIHNPHYYEFLRKQNGGVIPRNPGDDPCAHQNQLPGIHYINRIIGIDVKILDLHRFILHIDYTVLRRITLPGETDERDLRVKYLMENIPDSEFKVLLQQREKKKMKLSDLRDIYVMFVQTSIAKFHEILQNKCFEPEDQIYFDNLIKYFNETALVIGKRYKSVSPRIVITNNNQYHLISNKK
jgi:hypothetical protein